MYELRECHKPRAYTDARSSECMRIEKKKNPDIMGAAPLHIDILAHEGDSWGDAHATIEQNFT